MLFSLDKMGMAVASSFTENAGCKRMGKDGEVARYYRILLKSFSNITGEVRALRLAGHSNIFPTYRIKWYSYAACLASKRS
ncbi:hypothetical protein P4S64_13485 [Vibrio sp. M60_M31a]